MGFFDRPVLENEYVRIEVLAPEFVGDLSEAVGVGELWETWYTAIPSPTEMDAEIASRLARFEAEEIVPFVVIDKASGKAAGMTCFLNVDTVNRRVEIGSTWLGKAFHGTAVNPSAKLLLMTYAFEELECIAVEFRTHWHNHQSRAAIAKLGAKQDGVLRNHWVDAEGILRDTVVFSVIASEWPTVRKSLQYRLKAYAK